MPRKARPGDIIVTECRAKLWALPCHGIRGTQRWLTVPGYVTKQRTKVQRGYPTPFWRKTHVGLVLDGDVVEATFPHARRRSVGDFCRGHPWQVVRRKVDGQEFRYPRVAIEEMRAVAAEGLVRGRAWYDVGQLFQDLVLDLYGRPRDEWDDNLDWSSRWRVCSAFVAWIEESARRACTPGVEAVLKDRYGDAVNRGQLRPPWPRAFRLAAGGYVATERVYPADFVAHGRDYLIVESGKG